MSAGPAQVIPAMRRPIRGAMVKSGAFIFKPKQIIRIDVPTEQMGGATREVGNRRCQIMDMAEERGVTSITTKIPAADMFGFNSALKSATGGLGFFWLIDIVYEPLPRELQVRGHCLGRLQRYPKNKIQNKPGDYSSGYPHWRVIKRSRGQCETNFHPFITPSGTIFATFLPMPASSTLLITSSISL